MQNYALTEAKRNNGMPFCSLQVNVIDASLYWLDEELHLSHNKKENSNN